MMLLLSFIIPPNPCMHQQVLSDKISWIFNAFLSVLRFGSPNQLLVLDYFKRTQCIKLDQKYFAPLADSSGIPLCFQLTLTMFQSSGQIFRYAVDAALRQSTNGTEDFRYCINNLSHFRLFRSFWFKYFFSKCIEYLFTYS